MDRNESVEKKESARDKLSPYKLPSDVPPSHCQIIARVEKVEKKENSTEKTHSAKIKVLEIVECGMGVSNVPKVGTVYEAHFVHTLDTYEQTDDPNPSRNFYLEGLSENDKFKSTVNVPLALQGTPLPSLRIGKYEKMEY